MLDVALNQRTRHRSWASYTILFSGGQLPLTQNFAVFWVEFNLNTKKAGKHKLGGGLFGNTQEFW